ncbi:hypothetical protein ABIE40_000649 [Rhizobium sp. OAE497]
MCDREFSALVRRASIALRPISTEPACARLNGGFQGLASFFAGRLHLGISITGLLCALFSKIAEGFCELGRIECSH